MLHRSVLTLRGPSIWATTPMLEVWLDLEGPEDPLAHQLAVVVERARAWHCAYDRKGDSHDARHAFFERLRLTCPREAGSRVSCAPAPPFFSGL